MQESAPTREKSAPRETWLVAFGLAVMIGWVAVHVALFYLFFAGGAVMEILLHIARAILFPGASAPQSGQGEMFGWTWILQTGVLLTGTAGVPAGLAFFWRSRRKVLIWGFGILFLAGLFFELSAVCAIAMSALPRSP